MRLIAVVRDPLCRLWSSFHYSYSDLVASVVKPSLDSSTSTVAARAVQFVEVEIQLLESCFAENGYNPRLGSNAGSFVDITVDCFESG